MSFWIVIWLVLACSLLADGPVARPTDPSAHLQLALARLSQYSPWADTPENLEFANQAASEFQWVLQNEAYNTTALASIAWLKYQQAQKLEGVERSAKLDETSMWYERLIVADPLNKDAHHSLAEIDWMKLNRVLGRTHPDPRKALEPPRPLPDPQYQQFKEQYCQIIEHGISQVYAALQIDPQFFEVMAIMSLLLEERADLAESPEQYRHDIEMAFEWANRSAMTSLMIYEASSK